MRDDCTSFRSEEYEYVVTANDVGATISVERILMDDRGNREDKRSYNTYSNLCSLDSLKDTNKRLAKEPINPTVPNVEQEGEVEDEESGESEREEVEEEDDDTNIPIGEFGVPSDNNFERVKR
ncbi:hypothetical protein QJS04_geneDACA017926 [Acorus gramineus]|uniref:Uncharacterized protein n=1 Tax=Acorus gramineus TaxID=55184 RepID=A0AAV9BUP6_ACOGR|nr:hypothetical protein QJS04_geneDACA017926 [Acorus gramineus]